MDREKARAAYRALRGFLSAERENRERWLKPPRREEALREIDAAVVALRELGVVVGEVFESVEASQKGLFD